MRIRTGLAETGDRTIDERRIQRTQGRGIQTVLCEAADFEILDDDIGAQRKRSDPRLALRGGDIDCNRALSPIAAVEIGGAEILARGRTKEGRAPLASIVAFLGPLDFDDVGAKVGQKLSRPRTRQDACQLEHANARQRQGCLIDR